MLFIVIFTNNRTARFTNARLHTIIKIRTKTRRLVTKHRLTSLRTRRTMSHIKPVRLFNISIPIPNTSPHRVLTTLRPLSVLKLNTQNTRVHKIGNQPLIRRHPMLHPRLTRLPLTRRRRNSRRRSRPCNARTRPSQIRRETNIVTLSILNDGNSSLCCSEHSSTWRSIIELTPTSPAVRSTFPAIALHIRSSNIEPIFDLFFYPKIARTP